MIDPAGLNEVLSLVLPALHSHQKRKAGKVFILALSGLQGSGKSTWAAALCKALNDTHGIHTRTLSLDDLYHSHHDLGVVRDKNPENPLLRTRGQPGTHDEVLARRVFMSLQDAPGESGCRRPIRIPAFDKSQFNGEGDRVPEEKWDEVSANPPLGVLIFEGWCLGFRPLSEDQLEAKWNFARLDFSNQSGAPEGSGLQERGLETTTLGQHALKNLLAINENLRRYYSDFMGPDHFDALIQLTTYGLDNVYKWRIDQEKALWARQGAGMTDVEVIRFVRGYLPSYELYLDRLNHEPFFPAFSGKKHVRVVLDSCRIVREINDC